LQPAGASDAPEQPTASSRLDAISPSAVNVVFFVIR
jgi:hypothetical protein